jgi:hypothetical protein
LPIITYKLIFVVSTRHIKMVTAISCIAGKGKGRGGHCHCHCPFLRENENANWELGLRQRGRFVCFVWAAGCVYIVHCTRTCTYMGTSQFTAPKHHHGALHIWPSDLAGDPKSTCNVQCALGIASVVARSTPDVDPDPEVKS